MKYDYLTVAGQDFRKRFMENILQERNAHPYEKEAARKGLKETEEKL